MNKIILLSKTLSDLGFKKEAIEVLSLKKIAYDPKAYNKVRSNIFKLENFFFEISKILSEYLEYKRTDPEDIFLSDEEVREISKDIFQKLNLTMTIFEESFELTGDLGWHREGLIRKTRGFLSELEVNINRFYKMIAGKVYRDDIGPGIKKINLAYWKIKFELLSKKCREFLSQNEGDILEEATSRGGSFTFDPARENTVVGLEPTGLGGEDEGTSIEVTLPTSPTK